MKKTERYPAQVFWSDDDEGYIALATDLPGCSAFGESQQQALDELQSAIAAWIEAAEKAGNAIPAPSRPAEAGQFSGKVLLRMPKDLHRKLARGAAEEGTSLNNFLVYMLTTSFTYREAGRQDFRISRSAMAEPHLVTVRIASEIRKLMGSPSVRPPAYVFEPLRPEGCSGDFVEERSRSDLPWNRFISVGMLGEKHG